MTGLYHQEPATYGPAANGNIPEAIIIGAKDPGKMVGKVTPGNQGIGKMVARVTNGIKAAGRNKF
jgi:hypothetical protein